MTSRRATLLGLASLCVVRPALAKQRIYRLGLLSPGAVGVVSHQAFFTRLEELGYRVSVNLLVDRRFAEGRLDRLPTLADELVALKPDLLYSIGTQATLAASKSTQKIPIVFVAVTDPVGLGIIKSLRQPGTNATGLSNQADEAQIKLLQLVRDAFPEASNVAILYNPLNQSESLALNALRKAGVTLGLSLQIIEARAPEDFVQVFNHLRTTRPDVLYVMGGPLMYSHRERIVSLVNEQRQKAVYGLAEFADAGGLMSFAFNLNEQHRASASFVSKILKGENPADLPVEQPTRFELVLNLKTAKTQGIRFPTQLLLRPDRVIE